MEYPALPDAAAASSAFVDHLPWPASVRTAGGILVHANPPALALYGAPMDVAQGAAADAATTPDIPAALRMAHNALFARVLETGVAQSDEVRIPDPRGAHPVLLSLFPIHHGGELLIGTVVIDEQLHQRRAVAQEQAEALARQSDDLLRSFIHNSPVLLTLRDTALRYIDVSHGVCARFNRPRSDWIGRTDLDLTPDPTVGERRQRLARQVLETGETVTTEDHFPQLPGLVLLVATFPLRNPAGTIIAVGSLGLDISAQKRAEAKVAEQARQLEEFTWASAHDLKEPLRSASVQLSMLLEDLAAPAGAPGAERLGKVLASALDSLGHAMALVDGMLDLGQIERDTARRERVDLDVALEAVHRHLGSLVAATGGTLTVEPLGCVAGDPLRLQQLLQNLVGNALKFHAPGRPPQVRVHRAERNGRVHLYVDDNGIGIPPDDRERVFGIFERLHKRSAYAGHGIGLTLCRAIAALHDGRLHLEAGPDGTGTRAVLNLPAAAG